MSPTILRQGGYRYFFFSREEPRMHVHVRSSDGEAKFWLAPNIELARNHHLKPSDLRQIETTIRSHYNEFIEAWNDHFGS